MFFCDAQALKLVALLGALIALGHPAHSARVLQSTDERCALVLSGRIEPGDAQLVQGALQSQNFDQVPVICLDSPGGSFIGGLELSQLFMHEGIGTYLRDSDECFSACAIAFLGGSAWGDFRHAYRRLEPGSALGFHAPYLVPVPGEYDHNVVAQAAQIAVEVIRELINDRESLKISDRFVVDFLLDTDPQTRRIETILDLAHSGVDLAKFSVDIEMGYEELQRACSVIFSVHNSRFSDPVTSWKPIFEIEQSEFSRLLPADFVEFNGVEWQRVSMQHAWGTPWQTASCAFSGQPDHFGNYPAIIWSNGVGEFPNLDSALRTLRLSVPPWYFLGPSFRLSGL